MVLNSLQSCLTVSDEELDFAHHYKSFMMVLEKFSGTQAMVLPDTSWSSLGHAESMTGLLWTFGRGKREERETLSWQRESKSTWSLEAGNLTFGITQRSQLTRSAHSY